MNINIQKRKFFPSVLLFVLAMFLLNACSNIKYLPEKETLYIGPHVKILDTTLKKSEKKDLQEELESIVRPKPNSTFLKLRYKLWFYNIAGNPKSKKGLRYWFKNRFGEAPVYGSEVDIKTNTKIINNYLENRGYFSSMADGEKLTKKRKTEAHFDVIINQQSLIHQVKFEDYGEMQLGKDVLATQEETFLKPGNPYNLEDIQNERLRINDHLKLKGYYYFSPEYLYIEADTGVGPQLVDLSVKLKLDEMPENAKNQYTIGEVIIDPNYRITREGGEIIDGEKKVVLQDPIKLNVNKKQLKFNKKWTFINDTVLYKDLKIIGRNEVFKPKVFKQAMKLEPGDLYNKSDQNIALNRLVTLGTFKFVKNEFIEVEDTSAHVLDLIYLLTPAPRKAFNLDFSGYSQDDNRLGSRLTLSWRNRNFLKGAELFNVRPSAGFEMQFGGGKARPNAYNFGLETNLNVPRFIVPFFKPQPAGMFIPRTIFNGAFNFSFKGDYYKIYTYTLGFGYNWKENVMKDHKLFPINISYVRTDTLNKDSLNKVNLSNLVYNGIIIGPTYEFTYNTQLGGRHKNNFYFWGAADLSGNILGLAQRTSLDKAPKEILKSPYAQYVKLQTDFRFYHEINEQQSLAVRLFLGFGYAYGNSYQLPNIKQFFSGGSSGMRGFASRLVGPGTFNALEANSSTSGFLEMLGDIKQEMNLEWRFGIYKFIKGAVFTDAGNIWLLRERPDMPGAQFTKNFYKELAVDAGVGLRLDVSILILRFDFAMPVRKPWEIPGEEWTIQHFDLLNKDWRRQHLYFNFAIGYPF